MYEPDKKVEELNGQKGKGQRPDRSFEVKSEKKPFPPEPTRKRNECTQYPNVDSSSVNNDRRRPVDDQADGNAKRAKLTSLSDTTLQDLPSEILEDILVKAVAMEVKDMNLAKSVWKEKADLVINTLKTVCWRWGNILETNFFRNKVHGILDGTAQETIQLDAVDQALLPFDVVDVATMKDEIFMLCGRYGQDFAINVYSRSNLIDIKDVIDLKGMNAKRMASCSFYNSLYVLNSLKSRHHSVLAIEKDGEEKFTVSNLIRDAWMVDPSFSVAADGSIILAKPEIFGLSMIKIFDTKGLLQHKIKLPRAISCYSSVIRKSNGNLVLVSANTLLLTKLTEIDMQGTILRQHQSSLSVDDRVCSINVHERVLLGDCLNKAVLLDSQYNVLVVLSWSLNVGQVIQNRALLFNSEKNEIVTVVLDPNVPNGLLRIFHLRQV